MNDTLRTMLAAATLFLATTLTLAHDYGTDTLEIEHPWARPTITKSVPGSAYMTIRNTGSEDDTLLAVTVPGDVADSAELHTTIMENGIARMRLAKNGLRISAGSALDFKPLGNHVMLIGLKNRLEPGMKFKAALLFERAGRIEVEFWVEQPADGAGAEGQHDHHGHL